MQEKAKRGERGRSFADKIMAVFARIDTAIAMPPCPMGGRTTYHPLSIVLAPREVEYVEENEPVRPTRDMDVSPNEVNQYSERHDCSRKTPRVAHRDVPDGFYKPMASHMVQMAGDADKGGDSVSKAVFADPQAFAVGTPLKGIRIRVGRVNRQTPD